jgi:hypothetical protein
MFQITFTLDHSQFEKLEEALRIRPEHAHRAKQFETIPTNPRNEEERYARAIMNARSALGLPENRAILPDNWPRFSEVNTAADWIFQNHVLVTEERNHGIRFGPGFSHPDGGRCDLALEFNGITTLEGVAEVYEAIAAKCRELKQRRAAASHVPSDAEVTQAVNE